MEYLQRSLLHFAQICAGQSPLYAALSRRVAENSEILSLASVGQERQPPPNLLFGAVNYLLMSGVEHPLAAYYPSVGGDRSPAEAFPAFEDFCGAFREQILEQVATRRVQTNEIGRAGLLMPALATAWTRFGRRPLSLIEVGASAGLHLQFDQYRYEYRGAVEWTLGPDSPARIRTELCDGRVFAALDGLPSVAERVGIDIDPVDMTDESTTRWLEALVWADQPQRLALLRAAIQIARESPPRLIAGDGMDLVPGLVRAASGGALPCVFHSHATYLMSKEWRADFDAMLGALSRTRDLVHISLEWLGDDPGPRLHLTECVGGERTTTHLADCHAHGRWMRWLAE